MSVQGVVDYATSLSKGQWEEELLLPLCEVAIDGLKGRLKAGLVADDCEPAFSIASAMYALDYLEGGGGVTDFSAGDVTIRRGESASYRQRGERLMAPYVTEGGFAFWGVDG